MTSPINVLRRVAVWPIEHILPGKGGHRARRPVLLPDEPIYPSAEPVAHAIRDDAHLEQLLKEGEALRNAFATCPKERKTTFHSFDRNGMKHCWDCGTASAGDALGATTVPTEVA